MLQPTNRFTLLDSLRPPDGFSFDACMATTFTLDLQALLALPGIFAVHSDAIAITDAPPVDILHAIRKYAKYITVLAQAGEIAVPPSSKIFGFLEDSVIPVTAPRKGVVHPKVWVIRFKNNIYPNESKLRVIIASRNLTFDSSWDAIVRLDENEKGASLKEIIGLFTGLSKKAVTPIAPHHVKRIASLSNDLKSALFDVPAPFTDLMVHVFGFKDAPAPFPAVSDKSFIISPFISREFFTRVYPHKVDVLVSRIDQLPVVDDIDTIAERYSFDDGAAYESVEGSIGPAEPLSGLHAKIFGFDQGKETRWFIGSANATKAAFHSNVEILLELIGPKKDIGIDQALGNDGDDLGMESLFRAYSPLPNVSVVDEENSSFDSLRRALASQTFMGTATETDKGWKVLYSSSEVIDAPPDINISVWPINDTHAKRLIPCGEKLNQEFASTLIDISGFLAFKLQSSVNYCTFCVPVVLDGLPGERATQLMKALIGNPERFLGYLIALLDDTADNFGDKSYLQEESQSRGASSSFYTPPVLEKMVKAMRSEPHKLLEIQDLVSDLKDDDILETEFMDVWAAVVKVAHRGDQL